MSLTRWKSPPQNVGEILDFRYGPLKSSKTGIRLAQILPGSGNKGIAINLIDSYVTGPSKEPYDALSYTWGDRTTMKTINCNGKRLAVTQTLVQALHRFRAPDHEVTLWIDQICICQAWPTERNQQVQIMGDVFKGARKVIVWLGDDYADSKAGMQLAKQLLSICKHQPVTELAEGDLETHGLPKQGHRRWKALAAVLRRPWFWRTWVVQEVVLSPEVHIVLGASMFTWDELESIVALLEGPMPKVWQLDQAISASELPFSRINRIRIRHRREMILPTSTAQPDDILDGDLIADPEPMMTDDLGDDPELLDLLLMSRGLGATDPRDKIYALLGLGKHEVDIDYSRSTNMVFNEFAQQIIASVTILIDRREAEGLDTSSHQREVRRAMVLLACAGRHNQQLDLPSYVPDWTVNLASRPLIFGLGSLRFRAGGDKLGMFACEHSWEQDHGLQLSGILLDTIRRVGTVNLESDVAGNVDPHTLIRSWWEEAQQVALKRIARAPGSTGYTDAFEAMRRRLAICKHGYYIGESRQKRRGSLLDDADLNADTAHSASQTLTLGPTRGRVLFVSSTGFLGLVPHSTREGDVIFIIRGADVPYVLRPAGEAYELIGEAYVEGVMYGEALEMEQLLPQDVMIR